MPITVGQVRSAAIMAPSNSISTQARRRDWFNTGFILLIHSVAVGSIVYMAMVRFSWWTVLLSSAWFLICGLAITGGYHRLFSHRAYVAHPLVRAWYLFFGAAGLQNSARSWCTDHRRHHSACDTERDPYNIQEGFWWAHMAWITKIDPHRTGDVPKDLARDPLVQFQHRFYLPLAILAGFIAPMAIASLWGDAWGGLLVGGFLRLVFQWHATFSVNSFAHLIGERKFDPNGSARDNFFVALLTLGEGYHSFHHRFPTDYRNGVRWFQFDPTKWLIWTLSKVSLTTDLRRVPALRIHQARHRASSSELAEPQGLATPMSSAASVSAPERRPVETRSVD